MKTRSWIVVLLAVALVIPVAAQQTSPQSNPDQSQQQSSSGAAQDQAAQPSSSTQGQQAASPRQPLTMERHEGFWGKINPFARKKYVQRQLTPVADRVNELDELTAQNSKMIKDVDARASEGIRMASAKANEADQHAIEAGNRAQMANQTAQEASTRLQTIQQVVTNIDQYKPVTQAELRFRPGQAVLSKKAKEALDDLATPLKDQRGYIIQVQGFSAGHGAAAVESSRRMADAVVRYLVINHEIPVYRVHELGLGNTPLPAAEGEKPRRVRGGRVEITLLKNDLEQLASSQPIATQGANAPSAPANATETPNVQKSVPPQQQAAPAPKQQKPPDVPQSQQ